MRHVIVAALVSLPATSLASATDGGAHLQTESCRGGSRPERPSRSSEPAPDISDVWPAECGAGRFDRPRRRRVAHRTWLPWVSVNHLHGITGLEEFHPRLYRPPAEGK